MPHNALAVKRPLAVGLLLFCALLGSRAEAPELIAATIVIQAFALGIQGIRPDYVRAACIRRFGFPDRDVGSGVRIDEWDLPEGVLTFTSGGGPTFFDSKSKRLFHLLRTHNPAGSNILSGYEMYTLPDPAHYNLQSWLGNVKLCESTYRFKESGGATPAQRAAQAKNFFMRNPAGRVEIRYAAPVTAESLLETLPEGTVVARLVFTAADHKQRATFSITSSEPARCLRFGADQPLTFSMSTSWHNFWR